MFKSYFSVNIANILSYSLNHPLLTRLSAGEGEIFGKRGEKPLLNTPFKSLSVSLY